MYDFTDILAALVILIAIGGLIFFPVAILHAHKLRKSLRDARLHNSELQTELTRQNFRLSLNRAVIRDLKEQLTGAIEWNAQLLQEIEERKAQPLRGLTDEQLVEAIRKELTYRVESEYFFEWAFGASSEKPFWKIASKVGGAAFRVVDKAKRGKLEVQS